MRHSDSDGPVVIERSGGPVMAGVEEYRHCALDCLRLANETNDPNLRTFLLVDLAQCWNKLAEMAAKNSRLDWVVAPDSSDAC